MIGVLLTAVARLTYAVVRIMAVCLWSIVAAVAPILWRTVKVLVAVAILGPLLALVGWCVRRVVKRRRAERSAQLKATRELTQRLTDPSRFTPGYR